MTSCEGCGELLSARWALQDAVTDIMDEQSWIQEFRRAQALLEQQKEPLSPLAPLPPPVETSPPGGAAALPAASAVPEGLPALPPFPPPDSARPEPATYDPGPSPVTHGPGSLGAGADPLPVWATTAPPAGGGDVNPVSLGFDTKTELSPGFALPFEEPPSNGSGHGGAHGSGGALPVFPPPEAAKPAVIVGELSIPPFAAAPGLGLQQGPPEIAGAPDPGRRAIIALDKSPAIPSLWDSPGAPASTAHGAPATPAIQLGRGITSEPQQDRDDQRTESPPSRGSLEPGPPPPRGVVTASTSSPGVRPATGGQHPTHLIQSNRSARPANGTASATQDPAKPISTPPIPRLTGARIADEEPKSISILGIPVWAAVLILGMLAALGILLRR